MTWNWVDWLIALVLAMGIFNGFREGLVRLVIGFGAMIVGFFLASWLNGLVAGYMSPWITNRTVAVLVAYVLIFTAVIAFGALIASLIVRIFKLVGLRPMDRILGAVFGGVRAFVGLVITMMVIMAFLPSRLPAALHNSTLAPYVIGASSMVSAVTPFEIRSGVEKAYRSAREQIEQLRSTKRIPSREE